MCDPAGTRTQGPNIKSVVLYQLSYEINRDTASFETGCKNTGWGFLHQKNLSLLFTTNTNKISGLYKKAKYITERILKYVCG
jgi:hypothetical protein